MNKKTLLSIWLLPLTLSISCDNGNDKDNNKITVVDGKVLVKSADSVKLPDFTVELIDLQPGYLVAPKTNCTFKFRVRNIGDADYDGLIVVGNSWVIAQGVKGLKAGETKELEIKFIPQSQNSQYSMSFKVDPDNVIKESNESNNVTADLTIKTSV